LELVVVSTIVTLKGKNRGFVNDYGLLCVALLVLAALADALGYPTTAKVFCGVLLFGLPILVAIDECRRRP
jgi:hypothetical protein